MGDGIICIGNKARELNIFSDVMTLANPLGENSTDHDWNCAPGPGSGRLSRQLKHAGSLVGTLIFFANM